MENEILSGTSERILEGTSRDQVQDFLKNILKNIGGKTARTFSGRISGKNSKLHFEEILNVLKIF